MYMTKTRPTYLAMPSLLLVMFMRRNMYKVYQFVIIINVYELPVVIVDQRNDVHLRSSKKGKKYCNVLFAKYLLY